MEQKTGPLLTDREFFGTCLKLDLPGMEQVKKAVEGAAVSEDYTEARHAFAEHVRQSLQPDRFFSMPYEKPENVFRKKEETDLEAAERICSHCLISVGVPCQFGETVDWEANPTYNQYKEWTWQLSRHNEWKHLAYVYRNVKKDERYAKACADFFQSWVRQALCPGDVPGNETKCWRTIECGIRMGATWPYALHTFYQTPYFTDDVLVDWYKSLWEHGNRMQYHHWINNWLIMEMNGLAHIAILCPEFIKAEEWLAFSFDRLEKELKRQFYPDGFQFELSTNYHDVVIKNYQRTIQLALAYGVKVPDSFMDVLENAVRFYVKIMMPDGTTPDLNDGRRRDAATFIAPKLGLYPNRSDFEWVASHKERGEKPEYTSAAFLWSGYLVMRSGWESNAVWGLLDAAPFGTGHQHEDKLSFLLFAEGKLLVTEGGNYAYDDSEMRRYVLSTRSHNTIRVDGMDQNRRSTYQWKEEDIGKKADMTYGIGEAVDYASGVYDEGYGPDQDRSVTHRRVVYFIKKPEILEIEEGTLPEWQKWSPFFIVVDRLTSEQEHTYESLWHLDTREVQLKKGCAKMKEMTICSSMPDAETTIICGQETPEWQGYYAYGGNQGEYVAAPTISQKVRGSDIRMVTVFCPGQSHPICSVKASDQIQETGIELTLKDGRVCRLDEMDLTAGGHSVS